MKNIISYDLFCSL